MFGLARSEFETEFESAEDSSTSEREGSLIDSRPYSTWRRIGSFGGVMNNILLLGL